MHIIEEIREEIRAAQQEPSNRDMNILALLFVIIGCAVGAYVLFWKGSTNGYIWMAAAAALGACRIVPPLFRRMYRFWVGFSIVLGYFVSRILLTIIFFIVVLPTGIIMKILGKDPMDRKRDPNAATYWNRKEPEADTSIERYEKQF
ncbi:MAG: SxtJ family membrane protein [Desulfomonilaceae bacterium]|nr:SxtJ family membrane protein [Desulfomonilaceae bacterium]